MGFSVQPIESGVGKKNPIVPMPAGGFRTSFAVDFNAEVIDNNTIKLNYNDQSKEGNLSNKENGITSTSFGFIGAKELKFKITGKIEEVNAGFDRLTISTPYEDFEMQNDTEGEVDTYQDVDETYTLTIDDAIAEGSSCGMLCEITFDTIDSLYNDGVFYQIEFIE